MIFCLLYSIKILDLEIIFKYSQSLFALTCYIIAHLVPTSIVFMNTRRIHQRCSLEKTSLKNFAIFTGKHLCRSLFLIKLQINFSINFIKKRLQHRCFSVNIDKFLITPILKNIWNGCFFNTTA